MNADTSPMIEIHIWLEEALHERLRRAMFAHRLTKAAIVREAIRRELDRLDAESHKEKIRRTEGRR
jgi:hypothetical protein